MLKPVVALGGDIDGSQCLSACGLSKGSLHQLQGSRLVLLFDCVPVMDNAGYNQLPVLDGDAASNAAVNKAVFTNYTELPDLRRRGGRYHAERVRSSSGLAVHGAAEDRYGHYLRLPFDHSKVRKGDQASIVGYEEESHAPRYA